MSPSLGWLLLASLFVIVALWPADRIVGLSILMLAAFCLRMSRDLERT